MDQVKLSLMSLRFYCPMGEVQVERNVVMHEDNFFININNN